MIQLSSWQIFVNASAALVILTLHGAVFAAMARALGDDGPRKDGRLSLNPVAHVSIWAVISAVFGRVGWVRPVALEPARLALGRGGVVLCLVAALVAVWLVGLGALALRPVSSANLSPALSVSMNDWLTGYAALSGWMLVLGLVPVPPLPGGYLLLAIAPGAHARLSDLFRRNEVIVSVVVIAVFWAAQVSGMADFIRPVVAAIGLGRT